MTPEDLAAIRAMDAADAVEWEGQMWPDVYADRRALLAALDEANAECARSKAEVDRLRLYETAWNTNYLVVKQAERARILARVDKIPKTPYYAVGEEAEMCPNCVTPWKCNGPHEPTDREPSGYEVPLAAVLAAIEDA